MNHILDSICTIRSQFLKMLVVVFQNILCVCNMHVCDLLLFIVVSKACFRAFDFHFCPSLKVPLTLSLFLCVTRFLCQSVSQSINANLGLNREYHRLTPRVRNCEIERVREKKRDRMYAVACMWLALALNHHCNESKLRNMHLNAIYAITYCLWVVAFV